ncbi:MAG: GH25 family lysozyme [Bacteroidota bacterium]
MHTLSATEKDFLQSLMTYFDGKKSSRTLHDFFEKTIFMEEQERALIIQTIDHYAVFYLSPEKFDNQNTKHQEILNFTDQLSLLGKLQKEKYVTLLPSGKRKPKSMYFVQDHFLNPEPTDGNIILNAKGDFTHNPETIFDNDQNVVYKGFFLDSEAYDFLRKHLESPILLNKNMDTLLPDRDKEKEIKDDASNSKTDENIKKHTPIVPNQEHSIPLDAKTPIPKNEGALGDSVKPPATTKPPNYGQNPGATPGPNTTFDRKKADFVKGTTEKPKGPVLEKFSKIGHNVLTLLLVLTVGGGGYYLWNRQQGHNTALGSLALKNTAINNRLDSLMTRISLEDGMHKFPNEQDTPIDVIHNGKSMDSIHYGIDISHYDGDIIKEIQLHDSIVYVICKATEGLHFRDSYFHTNWTTAKEKKLIRGAYHFFLTHKNGKRQADHFYKTVGNWEDTDIAPVLDIEGESLPKHLRNKERLSPRDIANIQKNALEFLTHIQNKTNRVPIVYTGYYFANKFLNNRAFAKYPLWIADYSSKHSPRIPNTWEKTGYFIWQKSEDYHFKSGVEDLDVFYGELGGLYRH